MAKAKKKVSKVKTKKKLWFKVMAPKAFGQKEIGESYLTSVDAAIGRTLSINLRNLTGSMRDQNSEITFQISKAEGTTLRTTTIGYALTSAYVKRAVRKNTNRLDDYFVLKTKGGKGVILKTLILTLGRTQRSTRAEVRKQARDYFEKELAKTDFENFVGNLVNRKVQSAAKKALQKTHPLKEVAVRVIKLQKAGVGKAEVVVEEAQEEPAEQAKEVAEEESSETKEE